MFEVLPESTDRCIGFKISGKVTADDYNIVLPRLDAAIAAHGKVNLVVVLSGFDGYDDLDAAKADWHFGRDQYRQVEKAAFVGDSIWVARMVRIMDPFTRNTEERAFTPDQIDDAWAWAKAVA